MDVGLEEEGDEVVEQVLEEIGVDLSQAVCILPYPYSTQSLTDPPRALAWRNPLGLAIEYSGRDQNRPGGGRRRRRRRPRRRRSPSEARQLKTMRRARRSPLRQLFNAILGYYAQPTPPLACP
jgi:hypothetical protein